MTKKIIIAAVIIILSFTGYLALLKKDTKSRQGAGENQETAHTPPSPVLYVAAEGKVEAMHGLEIEVGSDLIARIERLLVHEGDSVKKGDVIVRLDNKDIQARLAASEADLDVAKARYTEVASGSREEEIKKARANLEAAQADMDLAAANLERYKQLYQEGVIPKSMIDERENQFKVAGARVDGAVEEKRLLEKGPKEETLKLNKDAVVQAEATAAYYKRLLEKSIIKAPISGKILRVYLEEGEAVTPETPILAVADVERVWINAEVDETDIGRIEPGYAAEVKSDSYPGKIFRGRIQEIADYVGARKVKPNNPAKNLDLKVVQVKIALEEKSPFKIGMTVDVRILPVKTGA